MEKAEYTTVSIKKNTFRRLTKLVGHHGFASTREVVSWCIRRSENQIVKWLEEIDRNLRKHGREFDVPES